MRPIYEMFNNESLLKLISAELADGFKTLTSDTVDFSFNANEMTGKLVFELDSHGNPIKESNTTVFFDTKPGTALDKLKLALFAEDLADLTAEEDEQLVRDTAAFLKKAGKLAIEKYGDMIRDNLRLIIMPNTVDKTENFPFTDMEMLDIELVDYTSVPESTKSLIKIATVPKKYVNTQAVLSYLGDRSFETGLSIEAVFEQERGINPILDYVVNIEFGNKYLFEVSISMFINYSYFDPNLEEKLKEITEKKKSFDEQAGKE